MIVQFNIMRSIKLLYLNFEENFLVFFSISLPNFLIFLVVSALMFLFRFSLFMSRWLSANWCFCAFLLLSSFWFIWFFCQCPSESSLASLPFLSLRSLNSDSWTERRIMKRNTNIGCLPGEVMLPLFQFITNFFRDPAGGYKRSCWWL